MTTTTYRMLLVPMCAFALIYAGLWQTWRGLRAPSWGAVDLVRIVIQLIRRRRQNLGPPGV